MKGPDEKITEPLLVELMAALDMLVLERIKAYEYRVQGEIPKFFRRLYLDGVPEGGPFRFWEIAPFIDHFLEQAEPFWMLGSRGRLNSGTWIENDIKGNRYQLNASALCIGDSRILLIQNLSQENEIQSKLKQSAREAMLAKRTLEAQVKARTKDIRNREEELAVRLLSAIEYRHGDTGAHIRRIGLYAELLAAKLGWTPEQCYDIRIAAPLHDVGMIAIPDSILLKPRRLNPEEFDILMKHPEIGYEMLKDSEIPLLRMAADIARYHHEKWDGTGYPEGLSGDAIPQSARLTTICDIFDALINSQVYRGSLTFESATEIIKSESHRFDPDIYSCFVDILPEIRAIWWQNLQEGSKGENTVK